MGKRIFERLLFIGVGVGATLLGFWIAGQGADTGPSEREERIARDLRIAREVERDLTKLRLKELERRRAQPKQTPKSNPPKPAKFETMRPTNRAEMVGRYLDDETGTIWLELTDDGRYVYEGIPGEFLEGARPPPSARVIYKNGKPVVVPVPPRRWARQPGYAQPHTGRWTFQDGVLEMEPFDPIHNAHVTFSWDTGEAAVRLRLLGVAPSHIHTFLLRHIVEPE